MGAFIVFELVFLPTLIYALLRGGKWERLTILILATAFTVSPLLAVRWATAFDHLELSNLMVGCVTFALLLAVSLRSEKFWPMWVTAVEGMVVLSHVAPLMSIQVSAWTYYMAHTIWSYAQLLLVAVATWEHQRYWAVQPVARSSERSLRLWHPKKPPGGPNC